MSQAQPLVSAGMPVYNGAKFLRSSLEALLAQDYPNIEIVISDNASEDETEAICRDYASRDPRIRYYRNAENLGAARNFNRVFRQAQGEFFFWAACDDFWKPSFIRQCVALLLEHPEASLCHVQSQQMTCEGKPFGAPFLHYVNADADVRVRWKRILADLDWHIAVYGMGRTACMKHSGLMRSVWGSDQLFVAEMALYGTIVQVPEQLWWHRRPEHISADDAYRLVMQKLDPTHPAIRRHWTQLGMHRNYVRIVRRARLPLRIRIQLVWDVVCNYVTSAAWANDLAELGLPAGGGWRTDLPSRPPVAEPE
jgi:glycosyltransferase involved in cell wall biosynthesis